MGEDSRALLARLPGCARLGPEVLDFLAEAARSSELARSAVLVPEGAPAPDWYAIVESGALQLSRADVEADAVLDCLTVGEVFDPGTPGLPAPCSASALEPTRCLLVPQSVVARHRAGLAAEPSGAYRGDLALFVRRVRELVRGPIVGCAARTPVAEAARTMSRHWVGSVVVLGDDGAAHGIVTDRDLRSKVVAQGLPPSTPVSAVMSSPLVSVDADALAFDALLEMTRRNIHHLGVLDGGRLAGVVSSHDVLGLQGIHPVALARAIDGQTSIDGLAAVAPQLHGVVRWLVREGAPAFDVARIVTELNDRLVRRTIGLTEASLEAEGHGRPPVAYCWLAAGSEGRREQTLRTDQDNGLLYANPTDEQQARATTYFAGLGGRVGAALERLGFPACDGGFMASNPEWRRPEAGWRETFRAWMENPHPQRVLAACIYFDIRPIAGDETRGRALWEWVCERAPAQALFLRYLARAAVERHPPLGFFGRFVVERSGDHKDTLDLKARGVFPMTQAMRVYALSLGIRETNTVDRLRQIGARGVFTPAQVDELRGAYEVICRLRLVHQLACLDAGASADNFLNPQTLGKADRVLLKEAFKTLGWLQAMLEDRFQTGMLD